MKFCILIELSKERISFLYNRSDSDNGFVPFEEQGTLPLAIYCDGNQMVIGQYAVNEANKKNPNAFIDVFCHSRLYSFKNCSCHPSEEGWILTPLGRRACLSAKHNCFCYYTIERRIFQRFCFENVNFV